MMFGSRFTRLIMLGAATACTAIATLSHAQSVQPLPARDGYPTEPIRFVSPFPPGGGNDATTRWVTSRLMEATGQPAVVENRGGAGGNIGAKAVATARPDGYTVLTGQVSLMAVNPALYSDAGFDPLKDFKPITQVNAAPLAIVVPANSPIKDFKDLVAQAKANPGRLTYASPGNGTLSHLVGVVLAKEHDVPLTHIPYRGAGPAINDLLGKQVDALVTSTSSAAGLIQSGQLRALAVTSPRRIGVFKQVPTLEELGLKGARFEDWYGFFVPAGTPPERVAYLHEAITRTLRSPEVSRLIVEGGSEVVASSPEDFNRQVREDIERWAHVVQLAGAKVD
ncbi:Bug family tripartite tricarboxylate transporter substrate binding protein [Bordetella sp. 15P40C-2]|uniref:Bug family tripartite tricarboxylate transporter substrate binding protein n=1 Tax=Bordetella sp. 15P40C-2 TaxID=2572246 RepID=UPI00351B933A